MTAIESLFSPFSVLAVVEVRLQLVFEVVQSVLDTALVNRLVELVARA